MSFFRDVLQDLSTALLAGAIGLIFYKRLNSFNRILLLQVLLYLLVDLVCLWIKVDKGDNRWLYNLFMPIEMGLLLMAAKSVSNFKQIKWWMISAYLVFATVLLLDLFEIKGWEYFANHAAIAEGVLLSVIFLFIIYFSLQRDKNYAVIFPAIGMALYFTCTVPYFAAMDYIDRKDIWISDAVFEYIVITLQLLRYFFIAMGFVIDAYRFKKQKAPHPLA